MSFEVFFQENILLIVAAVVLLFLAIALEFKLIRAKGFNLVPKEFIKKINEGSTLLDLRSVDDFKLGHIIGAKNVPSSSFIKYIEQFNKNDTILIYCQIGNDCQSHQKELKKIGYNNVFALSGGISSWQGENLPLSK